MWDVSSVEDMSSMFANALSFDIDLSKWDVSKVANMDEMFRRAALFKQNLCGSAWVHSKATKDDIFHNSFG